ncbi:CAAX prenyl protease-related protein [Desulfopila sp. IMCC35006]|uniref:CAAX prenyl protease-related protein n=1 Tax=Desulfopila sp. IMCC35006 TaxID=2569542 RepID=UPI0010AC688E|nr:CAAX prenyl protease-related protein [Desulfopila sp. IMCC35006]TKB25622.1 CAAX prenyl protease-related protein [Desulfopila sp. IMCC35006]
MKTMHNSMQQLWSRLWIPYVMPFALFMLLTEPARFFPELTPYLYITKTILVGTLLWFWREKYAVDFSSNLSSSNIVTAVCCGLLVLVIWIAPEKYQFQLGQSSGFDPHALGGSQLGATGLIAVRLLGSTLVVPVMEELFWRSFLMRYLVDPAFRSVPMGAFTWLSFVGVAVLFGLEHHRVGVGIIAGLLYGLLLVYQKNLKSVIIAHATTNFGLGVYILITNNWMLW